MKYQDCRNTMSVTIGFLLVFAVTYGRLRYGTDYWIGANDLGTEGVWRWSNGDPYVYSNWQSGEPNNKNEEDCGAIMDRFGYKWNDMPCSHNMNYICKKKDINDGLNFPCKNGGNCSNTNGSYSCSCPVAWKGKNCSTGSTKEPTVFHAAVGFLAGLLVISIFLSVCVCVQRNRRMQRNNKEGQCVNPIKHEERKDDENISENINIEGQYMSEAFSHTYINLAFNRTMSDEQEYATLTLSEKSFEHDYETLHLSRV